METGVLVSGIVSGSRIRAPVFSSTHEAHGQRERISLKGTCDKVPSAHSSSRRPASLRARRWAGGDADIFVRFSEDKETRRRGDKEIRLKRNRPRSKALPRNPERPTNWIHMSVCVTYPFRVVSSRRSCRSGLPNDTSYANGAASCRYATRPPYRT